MSEVQTIKLQLSAVKPGMILAEDIKDEQGRVLIPKDIRITPMFVNKLAKWNINEISVLATDENEASSVDTVDVSSSELAGMKSSNSSTKNEKDDDNYNFMQEVVLSVANRFKHVTDDPFMMQLKKIIAKKIIDCGPKGINAGK